MKKKKECDKTSAAQYILLTIVNVQPVLPKRVLSDVKYFPAKRAQD